jgi:hypothetical protein
VPAGMAQEPSQPAETAADLDHPVEAADPGPLAHHVAPARLEAELGFPLAFPEEPSQPAETAADLDHPVEAAELSHPPSGVGVGQGVLGQDAGHPGRHYTILDLPFTNVLQGWFLLKAGLDVSLAGEPDAAIRVRPWWCSVPPPPG